MPNALDLSSVDLNEATLLGILYTDGCLSPKGKSSWRLYLSNTSWEIIQAFRQSLIKLFNLPEYRVRIYQEEVNGKPFYKAIVDSKEIGQLLTDKYGTFRTLRYREGSNSQQFPLASLPATLHDQTIVSHFLKVAFSCDGGVNLYVARNNKYRWLIRNVYLACKHPLLIQQYANLLSAIGIKGKILWQDSLLRIQGKQDLDKFASKVGFMQGVEKQALLRLALASYGNPKSIYTLPQFKVKI